MKIPHRTAEEYNIRAELLKEVERQEQEMKRLQQNQRELALVKDLEKVQVKRLRNERERRERPPPKKKKNY